MTRYFPVIENGMDFMEFMHDQIRLDLRGQPLDGPNWFCATVHNSWAEDIIVAACACEFKTVFDVHFSCAVADPGCLSRRMLRGLFQALFTRAVRVTALVDPHDMRANDLVQRLGFVYEGFMRLGLDGFRDANLYGMLMSDCKFLRALGPPGLPRTEVARMVSQPKPPDPYDTASAQQSANVGSSAASAIINNANETQPLRVGDL